MQLQEFLKHLGKVTKTRTGYLARCRAHNDHDPSLSVSETTDKILVHCHAGCSPEAIVTAMGLTMRDLYLNPIGNGHKSKEVKRRKVATYPYTNEHGELLFEVLRYDPKDFRFRRPDGNGGWHWNLKDVRRVIYRLPAVLDAPMVFIVEGERDVETLEKQGQTATCCPSGAGKWKSEYNQYFTGKTAVILQDNDTPGRDHAEDVAANIHGIAKEVVVINLPGLPLKGDVTDFFENGGEFDDIIDLVTNAERWKPNIEASSSLQGSGWRFSSVGQLLAEPEEEVAYVWNNTLPLGGFAICSAKPKVGKSTVARNLAVSITNGEQFLERQTTKGTVLYLCLEEKRAQIANHFRMMGADGDGIMIHTGPAPDHPLEELELEIERIAPHLVIIDPLSRMLRAQNFNDYAEMARGLEPFIDLARATDCHILALHHDGKMNRSGGDALLGSTALFGAVDCHIQLKTKQSARTISTTQRYGFDMPETVFELDQDSGLIRSKGSIDRVLLEQAENAIMESFGAGTIMSQKDLKESLSGITNGQVSKAIRSLLDGGKIVRIGSGKRGDPYMYSLLKR